MQTRTSKRENGSVAHRILLDERLAKRKMLSLLREIEGLNAELNRLSAMADRLDLYDLRKRIDSAAQCAAVTVARMRRGISSI
jgi:hypothetical protein